MQLWIDDDVTITLHTIKNRVVEEFDVNLSISAVENYIKLFHYTFKRLHIIPVAADTEELWELRRQYALWLGTQNNDQ
jgi:hypothetical protein